MSDVAQHMEGVARRLLGEPNRQLSTRTEWRYGTHGSLSVALEKGTFYDHEKGDGGGVLDLIRRETGQDNGAALDWLKLQGFSVEERPKAGGSPRLVAAYDYRDERGELLFQVCRLEPKTFRQRKPDGANGWTWKLGDTRRVLYRLPEIVADAGATVFVVEGEKDAARLAAEGLCATTCPGGAGKWRPEYAEALAGRDVVILPDNDEAGRQHAKEVSGQLRGKAKRVAVLALDGLPQKGDVSDWLDGGGSVERLCQLVEEAFQQPEDETGLNLLAFHEDAIPWLEDAWLIEDVLPEQGLGVIFGAPGSRKTFTALDMVLHIASGLPKWRDKRVERRLCLYLSLEGGKPFKNRMTAWRRCHERDAPLFYRCADRLDLRAREDDANRVIASGKQLMEQTGERMGVVVIDTLNRAMLGGNENAVEDMGAFVALCDAIARELNCLVLIVHHSGKDAARGSRGHSSLLGAIDTELNLADGVLTVTKQRDGEDGLQFGVDLEPVEIGTTPTGKRVFSCVAVEGEITPQKGLPPQQRETVEAVREYLDQTGVPNPGGTGWPEPGARRMAETEAILAFLAGKQTNKTENDRRKCAGRKLDRLIEKKIVQTNEGFAWII